MAKQSKTSKTSNGERPNTNRQTIKATRDQRPPSQNMLNKLAAWSRGQNPWIQQEYKTQNGKVAYRRVRAEDVWGDPRAKYKLKGSGE